MRRLTRPEFLWPAAVIALLLSSAAYTFGLLYISRQEGGAQVIDRYYRSGVRWDSVAASRELLGAAGIRIDIVPAPTADSAGFRRVLVVLTDSLGRQVDEGIVTVSVFRPSIAEPLATRPASHDSSGYVVNLPVSGGGLWDFEVRGTIDDRPFGVRLRRELMR